MFFKTSFIEGIPDALRNAFREVYPSDSYDPIYREFNGKETASFNSHEVNVEIR